MRWKQDKGERALLHFNEQTPWPIEYFPPISKFLYDYILIGGHYYKFDL